MMRRIVVSRVSCACSVNCRCDDYHVIGVWCMEATWAALRCPPVSFECNEQFNSGGKAGHRFGRYPDTRVEWYGFRSPFVGILGQHLDSFLISVFPFQ